MDGGHAIGNHTFNHLDGWKISCENYIRNTRKCDAEMEKKGYNTAVKLFRPPYGKIKPSQAKALNPTYKIVMWDVLTNDFYAGHSATFSLEKSIKNTSNGSIIVFHDNIKAGEKLEFMLPRFLEHFKSQGYEFKNLLEVLH